MDQVKAVKSLVWRKNCESLPSGCTAKGSKIGCGGKATRFFVAISPGKDICFCKHYEKMNGKLFAKFVKYNFREMFYKTCNPAGRILVQKRDGFQNSKATKIELEKLGAI